MENEDIQQSLENVLTNLETIHADSDFYYDKIDSIIMEVQEMIDDIESGIQVEQSMEEF